MFAKEELLNQKMIYNGETLVIVDAYNLNDINDLMVTFDNGKTFKLSLPFTNGKIKFVDEALQNRFNDELNKKADASKEREQKIDANMQHAVKRAKKEAEILASLPPSKKRRIGGKQKPYVRKTRHNIAYKATYCDGNGDWFKAPCSEECRKYNCAKTTRATFCRKGSVCREVLDGKKPESAILESLRTNLLCYESRLLLDFTVSAGRKEKDNTPFNWNLRNDTLVVFTTIPMNGKEKDRIICGAMLVKHSYPKDGDKEAYATSYEDCRIALTQKEAEELKYWEYAPGEGSHKNLIQWNEKLWRFQEDITCATILKDIVAVIEKRNDPEQTAYARAFLDKYLQKIGKQLNEIPNKQGVLAK